MNFNCLFIFFIIYILMIKYIIFNFYTNKKDMLIKKYKKSRFNNFNIVPKYLGKIANNLNYIDENFLCKIKN
jgi:hypothetical protein